MANQQQQVSVNTTIRVVAGNINTTKVGFEVPIEIKVTKGQNVVVNEDIRLRSGLSNVLGIIKTDANGEINYVFQAPKEKEGEKIDILIELLGSTYAENSITITLPKHTGKESLMSNDPEKLILRSYHDGRGGFKISVRVMKDKGYGIKIPVVLEYSGNQEKVVTDKEGNYLWIFPRILLPGETCEIIGKVSGIAEVAKLKLRCPKNRIVAPRRWSLRWLFKTNNGRAVVSIGTMVVSWVICAIIGFGNPILFAPNTQLSEQQKLVNKLVGENSDYYSSEKELPKSQGDGQKYVWLFSLAVSLFTIIYAPLSLREEIAEGFENAFAKIVERHSASAGDPLYERILAYSGSVGTARKSLQSSTEGRGSKRDVAFSKLFASDILSDTMVEIIPSLIKSIFKR